MDSPALHSRVNERLEAGRSGRRRLDPAANHRSMGIFLPCTRFKGSERVTVPGDLPEIRGAIHLRRGHVGCGESLLALSGGEPEWFPPSRPAGLVIREIGHGRLVMSWQASRSLSSEQIRYEITLGRLGEGSGWKSPIIDGTEIRLPELASGTAHFVSVAAIDEQRDREHRIWNPPRALTFVP